MLRLAFSIRNDASEEFCSRYCIILCYNCYESENLLKKDFNTFRNTMLIMCCVGDAQIPFVQTNFHGKVSCHENAFEFLKLFAPFVRSRVLA